MQTKNKHTILKMIFTILMIISMIATAQLCHEKEFIFPEVSALCIGAWVCYQQPWRVNRIKMILLITIHASIGVCITSYLPISLYFQIILGFVICLFSLVINKTSFAPLISATILPIIMHTVSWLYPASAFVMVSIIAIIQKVLIHYHLCDQQENSIMSYHFRYQLLIDLQRIIFVIIMSAIAIYFNLIFLIAPPLLVAFVELTSHYTHLRNKPKEAMIVIFVCTLSGALSRYVFCEIYHLPLTFAIFIASILMIFIMYKQKLFFPPAGALTCLAMIVPSSQLLYYPFIASTSFLSMLIVSILISRQNIYDKYES